MVMIMIINIRLCSMEFCLNNYKSIPLLSTINWGFSINECNCPGFAKSCESKSERKSSEC